MHDAPYALLLSLLVLFGLWLTNLAYDAGMKNYLSRKIGHLTAGLVYFLAIYLFARPWWPLIISSVFALLLILARVARPSTFRGVGGTGRRRAYAELFFPICGSLALLNWVWSGNAVLGVLPILYLAFGDGITGVVRSWHCKKEKKGWCGTLAMLLVCLLVSYLLKPYWIGAAAAVVATLVERFTPLSEGWVDDNWTLTLSSAAVLGVLYAWG